MGQEPETEFKLQLVASINEELEQTHLGHRKGWLKKYIHPIQIGYSDVGVEAAKIKNIYWDDVTAFASELPELDYRTDTEETEQAVNNSGLDTDTEDYSSTCSDSGHVAKRRKMNHLAIQKQYLNQIHKDSIKLTERILALEEQSL